MYRLGDSIKIEREAHYSCSPEASLKVFHDVLCGKSPVIEYDLIILDTQEKLNQYNGVSHMSGKKK